jgi:hypothetical protein
MARLYDELAAKLPKGMQIPAPLKLLYDWIEHEGMYYESQGYRVGLLYPEEKFKKSWSKNQREGGTNTLFFARKDDGLGYWFGFTDKRTRMDVSGGKGQAVLDHLCVFAKTGAEGSMAALWLGEDGKQRIVHLGSGSGSTLVCVLAEDAVDFLRLLAIGYDELCWNEYFAHPPNWGLPSGHRYVKPNDNFQEWVRRTFGVEIPQTAAEIVRHPSEMDDEASEDLFWQWTRKHTM